ncbi:hypothetical protein [Solicola gregarius]|uniref:Uncharacterized protein n=1 Tax=Solicola gregarius TaxID=2908642 RepID=A0AA46TIM3_9ACTN|nr:hypothetical protein [Solicola gregarius]UYM05198.1 hypothetical protein L0C25_22200 [Solicola gregarius]
MTAPQEEEPTRTGHARVDAAMERLRGLENEPVGSHAGIYESVHDELRDSLTEAGTENGSVPGQ